MKAPARGRGALALLLASFGVLPAAHAASLEPQSPMLTASVYLDLAWAGERVVAVGDRGHIVYSDDAGSSWMAASSPVSSMLTAVCFADADHGWAVGHDAVILATSDGGASWTLQHQEVLDEAGQQGAGDDDVYDEDYDDNYDDTDFGAAADSAGAPLLDVLCRNVDHVLAVGAFGSFMETLDGGEQWQRREQDLGNRDGWHLYGITAVAGSDTLMIAGEKGILMRSRDGGRSWKSVTSPYAGSLFGIASTRKGLLAAYGLQGSVFVSDDEGSHWRALRTGVTRGINDMAQLPDGTVVFAGASGVVLVSHDNLASVTLQYVQGRPAISSLLPVSADAVIVAGDAGVSVVREQIR